VNDFLRHFDKRKCSTGPVQQYCILHIKHEYNFKWVRALVRRAATSRFMIFQVQEKEGTVAEPVTGTSGALNVTQIGII